jgi:hypothetical protein
MSLTGNKLPFEAISRSWHEVGVAKVITQACIEASWEVSIDYQSRHYEDAQVEIMQACLSLRMDRCTKADSDPASAYPLSCRTPRERDRPESGPALSLTRPGQHMPTPLSYTALH